MKFLPVGLLVATVLLAAGMSVKAADENKCPPIEEIPGCICFENMQYIACTNPKEPFKLSKPYKLDTLSISNTADLALVTEHTDAIHKLTVDSLTITQGENSPTKLPPMDNLEALFSLSTTAVKIISSDKYPKPLDISDLSTKLTSLTIIDVKSLQGFDPTNFPNLQHLVIHNSAFSTPLRNAIFLNSKLTTIEIIGAGDQFTGTVAFQPASCSDATKINIKIRGSGITNFDFSQLFSPVAAATSVKCQYHVDLSENHHLSSNLLTSQVGNLEKVTDNLYLILRDVPGLLCDCKVFKAYNDDTRKRYFHGIKCISDAAAAPNKTTDFLEKLTKANFKNCAT